MQKYQREFIDFAISASVLQFGKFVLKSGRASPYFFNAGLFNNGATLARLGRFYAAAIVASGINCDMLFGPAYKGIPLAAAASIALADHYNRNVPFAFNRKEIKDHGEGGGIVGAILHGQVLVIDDVISAGTSVREAAGIISAGGAQVAGLVIALDRQERGTGATSAIQEIEQTLGIQVVSIINLADMMAYLEPKPDMHEVLVKIKEYQKQYGV